MNDLITVIIPVYQVEKYLENCVNSVLQQTYENLEIILVDDGSTDRCPQMCDEFAAKDKRVRVIHKENGGLSSARNCGLDNAHGEWISFIDSDDYIKPDMIEKMLIAAKLNGTKICACGRIYVYEDKKLPSVTVCPKTGVYTAEEYIVRMAYGPGDDFSSCTKLYCRDLWDDIRFPVGRNNEDIATLPYLFKKTDRVCTVNDAFYIYCKRASSITGKPHDGKFSDEIMMASADVLHCVESYSKETQDKILQYYIQNLAHVVRELPRFYDEQSRVAYKKYRQEFVERKDFWMKYSGIGAGERVYYLMIYFHLIRPTYWVYEHLFRKKYRNAYELKAVEQMTSSNAINRTGGGYSLTDCPIKCSGILVTSHIFSTRECFVR